MEPFQLKTRTRPSRSPWSDNMIPDISQVLSDFLTGFQRNPMDAKETTELHKQLFSALYRQFSDAGVTFEMERSKVGMEFQPERKRLQINPVRTAYPPKEKFDIVILDASAATMAGSSTTDPYQIYWQQPLLFALNLHLCTEEEQVPKYLKAQQKDLRKMTSYRDGLGNPEKFIGLSLLLVDTYFEEEPGPEIDWQLEPGLAAWVVTPDTTFGHSPAIS